MLWDTIFFRFAVSGEKIFLHRYFLPSESPYFHVFCRKRDSGMKVFLHRYREASPHTIELRSIIIAHKRAHSITSYRAQSNLSSATSLLTSSKRTAHTPQSLSPASMPLSLPHTILYTSQYTSSMPHTGTAPNPPASNPLP